MTTRQEKLREALKAEVSDILLREFKDPRLGFVTVTDAEISPDLRHARIFVTILGDDDVRAENMAILKKAEHFVRQSLGKRLTMKVLPEIEFRMDTSIDEGVRIFELLERIKHDEQSKPS